MRSGCLHFCCIRVHQPSSHYWVGTKMTHHVCPRVLQLLVLFLCLLSFLRFIPLVPLDLQHTARTEQSIKRSLLMQERELVKQFEVAHIIPTGLLPTHLCLHDLLFPGNLLFFLSLQLLMVLDLHLQRPPMLVLRSHRLIAHIQHMPSTGRSVEKAVQCTQTAS